MRHVSIIGAGKTPFGAFPDLDLRALAVAAGEKALANAKIEPGLIESFYLGNFAGPEFTSQNHLAPYISSALGMRGIPSTRFEAACASSGAAFFQAYMGVASGIYDIVMVLGVEKMTSQPTPRVTEILAGAGDCATEVAVGSTFPSLFAMIARRHMHDFGTTRAHLSAVAGSPKSIPSVSSLRSPFCFFSPWQETQCSSKKGRASFAKPAASGA